MYKGEEMSGALGGYHMVCTTAFAPKGGGRFFTAPTYQYDASIKLHTVAVQTNIMHLSGANRQCCRNF